MSLAPRFAPFALSALFTLFAAAARGGAAHAGDEDPAAWVRTHEESIGPWRAWMETSTDFRYRRPKVSARVFLVRTDRPAAADPTPVMQGGGWSGHDFGLRLHPDGWIVATFGNETRTLSPGGVAGEARYDIRVTPSSRFAAGGFLTVAPIGGSGVRPAVRIGWAALGKDGLGPDVELGRVETVRHRQAVTEGAYACSETKGVVHVSWLVPDGQRRIGGGAALDTAAGTRAARPAPETVRAAAVQLPSVLGDARANLATIRDGVARAARAGAKFVVLPETCLQGYLSEDLSTVWQVPGRPRDAAFKAGVDPSPHAVTPDHEFVGALRAAAEQWGVWLTIPFLEKGRETPKAPEAGEFHNSVVLAGPDGRIHAHYRKLRPWPHPEQSWASAGNLGTVTAETPFGRVGLAICFDVHEVFPMYAKLERKPWTMLYPIAWVSDGDDAAWFGKELPRRAAEHGFHVVGANWSTTAPQPWHGAGWSSVISSKGEVLGQSRTRTGIDVVVAELPLAAQAPPK
ncbi:MAG: hypothetical protein HMLKMBBP_00010 [Planctomycetes bacterium]|nr:hypothetical protein [Planctomycetota bacterium]